MRYRKVVSFLMFLLFVGIYGHISYAAEGDFGINDGGSGNWRYCVLNEEEKLVEIRPQTLDERIVGVNAGNVQIPATIIGQDGVTEYRVT